ncbi:MAG: ABC transporter ATP-binding protein [Mariprofundus sp.]
MTYNIQCTNLGKSYQTFTSLIDVSVTLKPGTITGILGANGAGKSTLIKCILGLIQPTTGSVEKLNALRLGFLPELAQLPASLSAWQTIQLALRLTGHNSDDSSVLLQSVFVEEQQWHKPLRSFSKGMRQRVALAYAIAGDPQWLVLDEPMSGLDALGRKQFLDILLKMNAQGTSILVCSHIVPDLVRMCDNILLMNRGEIIETVNISKHSMEEAVMLENKLMQIAGQTHA